MDLSILFLIGVGALFVIVPICAAIGLNDAIDHLTSPPTRQTEPKILLTPEQKAEIAANVYKTHRQFNAMRAEGTLKPKSKSFFGDGSRPNPADWLPTGRKA